MNKETEKVPKHGTPQTGYMPPSCGPFRCDHCEHYQVKADGSGCDQEDVVKELGAGKNGLAPVDDGGCCNMYEPAKPEPIPFIMPVAGSKARKSIGRKILGMGA
jgi:hypothetical protein